MRFAIDEFRQNIARCQSALSLHSLLTGQFAGAYDLSDILRYTLASAVSAIDRYVHHAVELGMIESQNGARPHTDSYAAFRVSMASVHGALGDPPMPEWFLSQIRSQHALKTFQKSSDIHKAINLIQKVDIWALIARDMHVNVDNLRLDYDLIVERRNAIVHQADIDPTTSGAVTYISDATAVAAVELIDKIVESMHTKL